MTHATEREMPEEPAAPMHMGDISVEGALYVLHLRAHVSALLAHCERLKGERDALKAGNCIKCGMGPARQSCAYPESCEHPGRVAALERNQALLARSAALEEAAREVESVKAVDVAAFAKGSDVGSRAYNAAVLMQRLCAGRLRELAAPSHPRTER